MEFLITESVKINWYYLPSEITEEINKERLKNHLTLCSEDNVKSVIDFLKMGVSFLKLEDSIGSKYCMFKKKQVLIFSMNSENKEMIKEQIQGLFDFIITEMGRGTTVLIKDVHDQAYHLQDYYYKRKFTEHLDKKLPEKQIEKASEKKPKI